MNMFDLSGKVVLVTGGNRGIGKGFVEGLLAHNAKIAVWGSSADNNQKLLEQIQAAGYDMNNFRSYVVDVSNEDQVKSGCAQVLSDFGRIDGCFANAGIGSFVPAFDQMSYEDFRKVLAVNLDGVFFTLREVVTHMKKRAVEQEDAGGSLVVVSSLAAIEGAARNEHYAASKGAVISMMKSVAVEYARYKVRVNAILPGWIATDMTQASQQSQAFTDKVIPRIPIRRWGEAKDFSAIAVYLMSDSSSYHTADSFIIDGGYSVF